MIKNTLVCTKEYFLELSRLAIISDYITRDLILENLNNLWVFFFFFSIAAGFESIFLVWMMVSPEQFSKLFLFIWWPLLRRWHLHIRRRCGFQSNYNFFPFMDLMQKGVITRFSLIIVFFLCIGLLDNVIMRFYCNSILWIYNNNIYSLFQPSYRK